MVKRCVAAGCSNTYKDGVSLFLFPKDPVIFKKWAQQVQRGRDKWKPSQHSVLCSCHFAPECYEPSTEVLGLEKQKPRLKGDAVPTLLMKPVSEDLSPPAAKKRRIGYFVKGFLWFALDLCDCHNVGRLPCPLALLLAA